MFMFMFLIMFTLIHSIYFFINKDEFSWNDISGNDNIEDLRK